MLHRMKTGRNYYGGTFGITHSSSDVTGLKFPGFGRAGPNFFGPRAGPGFLMSGFGRALGPFQKI